MTNTRRPDNTFGAIGNDSEGAVEDYRTYRCSKCITVVRELRSRWGTCHPCPISTCEGTHWLEPESDEEIIREKAWRILLEMRKEDGR